MNNPTDNLPPGSLIDIEERSQPGQPGAPPPAGITKAVALSYDKKEDPVPRIVASGKGEIAEKILRLAFANGVRVREDKELVEILSTLELDSLIPLEAFAAVAEILSYVYKMNALYGDSRKGS